MKKKLSKPVKKSKKSGVILYEGGGGGGGCMSCGTTNFVCPPLLRCGK